MKLDFDIPKEVSCVTETLQKADFEAYLVGGCVRDLLFPSTADKHKKPKDWDITTNAKPEEIVKLFPKTVYENKFGTVAVINENVTQETLKVIEVTPYRLEAKYSDKRHPDSVSFTRNLDDDLKRRDFTINAMALSSEGPTFVDLFNGKQDLENKIIRAVGDPEERFSEDALRMLRAVRFSVELGFSAQGGPASGWHIEQKTLEAIKNNAKLIVSIAKERIKDEFVKIIMSDSPDKGIEVLHETGLLKFIIPELEEGIGKEQNKDHVYDVWNHSLKALKHSADKSFPLNIRLGALMHDIGKPVSRRWSDKNKDWTFYGHDVIGGRMAAKVLSRLKFSKSDIDVITKLVRYHLFFSDVDKITLSAVRRIVKNVGADNVWDLMKVRFCDRIGMGRPKESPYRLRKYESMIEEAMRSPTSVSMLKIDGAEIMRATKQKPGPKIGFILHALLEEVLDDPKLNTKDYLEDRASEFIKLSEKELEDLGKKGRESKEKKEAGEIEEIRKKWWVK